MRLFQIDTLICLIIFALSVYTTTLFYGEVVRFERPDSPIHGIGVGERAYRIESGKRCVGYLTSSLLQEKGFELKGTGELRLGLEDRSLESVSLFVEAYFNSLGQLGGSILRFESQNLTTVMGTTGVNPFTASLKVEAHGKELKWAKSIPGPLELVELDDNTYSLRHHALRQASGIEISDILKQNFKNLVNLDVREVAEVNELEECKEGQFLDMGPLQKLATRLARSGPGSPNIQLGALKDHIPAFLLPGGSQ